MITEDEMENINVGDWISYLVDNKIVFGEVIRGPRENTNLFGIVEEPTLITNSHRVYRSEILEVRNSFEWIRS